MIGVYSGVTTTTLTLNDAGEVTLEANSGGTLNNISISNVYDQFLRRTNVAVLSNTTVLAQWGNTFDPAGRLSTVSDGTNSAAYSYLANSSLVGQIVFANSGTAEMTTSKAYDHLNRLTSVSNLNTTPTPDIHTYAYNNANQRTNSTNADGSYWAYLYDPLGQVTNGVKHWTGGAVVAGQQFGYNFDNIHCHPIEI